MPDDSAYAMIASGRVASDDRKNESDFSLKVMSLQKQGQISQRNDPSSFNKNFFRFKAPPQVELNDVENQTSRTGGGDKSNSHKQSSARKETKEKIENDDIE